MLSMYSVLYENSSRSNCAYRQDRKRPFLLILLLEYVITLEAVKGYNFTRGYAGLVLLKILW